MARAYDPTRQAGYSGGRPTYFDDDDNIVRPELGGGTIVTPKRDTAEGTGSAPSNPRTAVDPGGPRKALDQMTEEELLKEIEQRRKGAGTKGSPLKNNGFISYFAPGGHDDSLDTERFGGLRDAHSALAKIRESRAIADLDKGRERFNAAVDAQLAELLEETGFQADRARETVGGAASARGVGRSTFAQESIGEVSLKELEQKSSQRLRAAESRSQIEKSVTDTKKGIERKREAIQRSRDLTQLDKAEDIKFAFDKQELQQNFEKELVQMKLDARDHSLFVGLVGDALGSVAKVFAAGGG